VKVKRVLVVQPFGIGDALFVTPLLRSLREEGKVEKMDLILGSRTREVFEKNPFIDEIFIVDMDQLRRQGVWKSFLELAALLFSLHQKKYDLFVDCSLSRRYAFLAKFFLRIPERIGFDYKKRGLFLSRIVSLTHGYRNRHVIEYYADLGRMIGIPVTEKKPDFFVSEEDEKKAKEFLLTSGVTEGFVYIVVAPGGGESWGQDAHFKRWSPEYFAETINKLSGEISFDGALILGSRGEFELGERVKLTLNKPAYNFCGKISIRESAAILKRSLFLFSNDSGLVHVARALEIPLIALYGPVDEKIYGPYPYGSQYLTLGKEGLECRPCYQSFRYNAECAHRECLTRFYPDEVLTKILANGFLQQITAVRSLWYNRS